MPIVSIFTYDQTSNKSLISLTVYNITNNEAAKSFVKLFNEHVEPSDSSYIMEAKLLASGDMVDFT